ncbi:MAG: HD domain-containing protein [Candidatus Komeilibacteria bacterium]|nr:HD domain-containing protein [Candidatus Komeilibacteria bacterium]
MLYQDKIYGPIEITEPVILELLATPQMQRLKKIHQQGNYFIPFPEFNLTRFDHSLGVMLLLKRFKAPFAEQVAGLLHDLSHGPFSHVIDHLYNKTANQDHQDSIHLEYFGQEIKNILTKYDLNYQKTANLEKWPLLDNELPDICADRLDYTLRDGECVGRIIQAEVEGILSDLIIEQGRFVFRSLAAALKFANLSYYLCRYVWHVEWGEALFQMMAEVLKLALEDNLINEQDLQSGDDDSVLAKLQASTNPKLAQKLAEIKNLRKEKVVEDKVNYRYRLATKNRVINPLVKINGAMVRVSEVDQDFKNKYESEKIRVKQIFLKVLE